MVRAEPSETDPPEGGKDVAFDVAFVAGVGASREHEPFPREPVPDEVGPEGERPGVVVTAIGFGGQSSCESFGVSPVGSSGVPAPPLPTGDRVESFVDHGVPTATFVGDVAFHRVLLPGSSVDTR
jgi:hypothetical protein